MIVVLGDSWACGEWGLTTEGPYGLLHRGTVYYLQKAGYHVYNLAHGASSNKKQVDKLHAFKEKYIDHVIWFLTDPLRDISEQDIATTMKGYREQQDTLLRNQFDRVRMTDILLIGGVHQVPNWVSEEYPNIQIVTPNLRCYLLPYREHIETLCRTWVYPARADKTLIDHWTNQEIKIDEHIYSAEYDLDSDTHKLFWPDGHHPNRNAHLRLVEELLIPIIG